MAGENTKAEGAAAPKDGTDLPRRPPRYTATNVRETRLAWPSLSGYERFEQVVVLLVGGLVAVMIVVALFHLFAATVELIVASFAGKAGFALFQAAFGMVLTVLIALEFNHSIVGVFDRSRGIVQVRTIVLIALIAMARKFMVLDSAQTEALKIVALAAAVLALGLVYWLLREQDRRDVATDRSP